MVWQEWGHLCMWHWSSLGIGAPFSAKWRQYGRAIPGGTVPSPVFMQNSTQSGLCPVHPGKVAMSRLSWLTHFECPILRVSCFTHSPVAEKLPHCRVTGSSRLQRSIVSPCSRSYQNYGPNPSPFKQMLDKTSPNLKALMGKCELHYQFLTL